MSKPIELLLHIDSIDRQLGGIGRYTWELAQRLPQQEAISSVCYFGRTRLIDDPGRLLRGDPIYRGRGLTRVRRAWQARNALRSRLVHGPNYFLPKGAETGVITVHDLSVFFHPETHPASRISEFERLFINSLERASYCVTDTETVRRELIESFSVPQDKVVAIPLGVSAVFKPIDRANLAPTLARFGLRPGRYGLCVSALEPRKKVTELLAAWSRLPGPLRARFPLVLAGSTGWLNERIQENMERAAGEGWFRNLGYVAERALPALYAGAALFVYPSVYEGFGLPPIEAMASGVPVIVAKRSCLPEVCGDAAQYVDPDDADQFRDTIVECLENDQLRAQGVARGLSRASEFTWNRCIKGLVGVYQSAANA